MVLPINQCGMDFLPPSRTTNHIFTTSQFYMSHVIAEIQKVSQYRHKIHIQTMERTIIYADIQKDSGHKTVKQVVFLACGEFERQNFEKGASMGDWLTVMPTHDNGMMLSPGEWRIGYFLRYVRTSPRLTPNLQRMWWPILSRSRQHM